MIKVKFLTIKDDLLVEPGWSQANKFYQNLMTHLQFYLNNNCLLNEDVTLTFNMKEDKSMNYKFISEISEESKMIIKEAINNFFKEKI